MELTREERAVWQVVSQYDKRAPIGRGELVYKVKRLGYDLGERQVREVIESLRLKEDYLICSRGGTNGGYYTPANLAEYDEYDQTEYGAKIHSMLKTQHAQRRGAERKFGHVYQQSMFGGGF